MHQALSDGSEDCGPLKQRICYKKEESILYKQCFFDGEIFKLNETEYSCPSGTECQSFGKEPCKSLDKRTVDPKKGKKFVLNSRQINVSFSLFKMIQNYRKLKIYSHST